MIVAGLNSTMDQHAKMLSQQNVSVEASGGGRAAKELATTDDDDSSDNGTVHEGEHSDSSISSD